MILSKTASPSCTSCRHVIFQISRPHNTHQYNVAAAMPHRYSIYCRSSRSRTCARLMSVAAFDLAAASSFCRSDSCWRSLSKMFCCSAWRRAAKSRRERSASLFAAATDA